MAGRFPGGQLAFPEGQNEEENKLRKIVKKLSKLEEIMRKVELLSNLNCEDDGYDPEGMNTPLS